MHFQCFMIFVLCRWYAFDWKAFLAPISILDRIPMSIFNLYGLGAESIFGVFDFFLYIYFSRVSCKV